MLHFWRKKRNHYTPSNSGLLFSCFFYVYVLIWFAVVVVVVVVCIFLQVVLIKSGWSTNNSDTVEDFSILH